MDIRINTVTVTAPNGGKIVWVSEIVRSGFGPTRVELFRNGEDWGTHPLSLHCVQEAVSYCTPSNRRRKSIAQRLIAA